MTNLSQIPKLLADFFSRRLWEMDLSEKSRPQALSIKALRVLVMAGRGFHQNNCALRASALTFYSLLAAVPVAALAFGIAKGFGLEQLLEEQLYQRMAGQEAVVEWIITFARTLLENTQGGLIAGIGVAVLFWSSLKVLGHIEGTLNTIWEVRSRSFVRKLTDYLSILVISPLLVIIASSVNVYIKTQVTGIANHMAILELMGPVIFGLFRLLPYALIWMLFILVYLVMPNTRVRIWSALVAGIFAGTVYQLSQGLYIQAQVLLSNYNAVYGSFAALPFFLIWLQLSWMIVLVGAQIAYSHQHVAQHLAQFQQPRGTLGRRRFALYLLHYIIIRFQQGLPPVGTEEMAEQLELSHGLAVSLVEDLVRCGLVSMVDRGPEVESGYQPAQDINNITIADMFAAWDSGGDPSQTPKTSEFEKVRQSLAAVDQAFRNTPANRLVKDL